jgi:hypothetical protein
MMIYRIPVLPVLVSAVVNQVLGMAWYSPLLFGKVWMTLSGIDPAKAEECKKKGMATSYLVSFLCGLVTAFVMGYALTRTFSATHADAARKAVLLWAGFVAPVQLGSVLWEKKPVPLFLINTGHYLVALLVSSLIIVSMI